MFEFARGKMFMLGYNDLARAIEHEESVRFQERLMNEIVNGKEPNKMVTRVGDVLKGYRTSATIPSALSDASNSTKRALDETVGVRLGEALEVLLGNDAVGSGEDLINVVDDLLVVAQYLGYGVKVNTYGTGVHIYRKEKVDVYGEESV